MSASSFAPEGLVRMPSEAEAVVFPLKTRMGLLVLLALGRMVSASWAWPLSGKEASAAARRMLHCQRFAEGGALWFHDVKQLIIRIQTSQ